MSVTHPRFWTRNDVAQKLELSVRSVANNEHRLGLDKARSDVNQRIIKYDATIAERELKSRKLLP